MIKGLPLPHDAKLVSSEWIRRFFADIGLFGAGVVTNVEVITTRIGSLLVRVAIRSQEDINEILRRKSQLRNNRKYSSVFIFADKPQERRGAYSSLPLTSPPAHSHLPPRPLFQGGSHPPYLQRIRRAHPSSNAREQNTSSAHNRQSVQGLVPNHPPLPPSLPPGARSPYVNQPRAVSTHAYDQPHSLNW